MRLPVKTSVSVSIILFSFLFWGGCKDVIFNNPLDPDASVEQVKIIKIITTSLGGAGDLCFDGEKFWKTGIYGNLDALDIESGVTIRSLGSVGGSGIAFFENKLYLCNGENILFELDSLSGDILNRISTTDLYPTFVTTGINGLVLFDQRSSGVFEYDPASGTATRLFQVSGLDIGGIEWYRGGLLLTDKNTDSLYHFSAGGAVLNVFRSPAAGVAGITVDGLDYIYLMILDGKIYKISLP